MTTLRKVLPLFLLALAMVWTSPHATAQTPPDCSFTFNFIGDSTQNAVSNLSQNTPCVNWRVTFSTNGTLSSTITFYTSPDATVWTAVPNTVCSSSVQPPCILQGANPMTGQQGMMYLASYGNYVQIRVSASSGSGAGSVRAYGAKGATASGGGGGTGGGGISPSPCTVAGGGANGTVAFGALTAAAASQEITIRTAVPGTARYYGILLSETTQFAGTTGLTVSMGRPGVSTHAEMTNGVNFPLQVSTGDFNYFSTRPIPPQITTTYNVVLNFAVTSGNVNAANAGLLTWEVCAYGAR